MPKLAAMANISRPFQIAVVGVLVLAGVWLFALHGGSSSTTPSSSAPAASASPSSAASSPSASTGGKGAAASTPVYHGSAPGVEGLTRAVAKAHGAVAASQHNEKQLEAQSAQASESTSHPAASASAPAAPSKAAPAQSAATQSASANSAHKAAPAASATHPASATTSAQAKALSTHARQRQVEAQLAKGKVVLILFWNKQGADDRAAKAAVESFSHGHKGTAVVTASSGEVAAFGTITRGVQVLGTPTILVVGKSGKAIVLTGLTDAFSLSQAISQARHS
jgi:cytoskeletal protein RodZ